MEARRTFHLTPISHRSFWSAIRQKDGTIVSQIRAEFMAKNRTNKSLRLLTARVVKPNILGDVLDVSLHTDVDSQYGGIDYLPQGTTMRLSVVIHIRDFPGRVLKNPPDLAAVLAVADDEGNEQRVKLPLKAIRFPLEHALAAIQRRSDEPY